MNQTTPQKPDFTIGQLAAAADVNVETIRYYQRRGLIQEPKKPKQGFRKYPYKTLETILFIKRAQQLGFSLLEISELIELGDGHCSDVRQRAEMKRDRIHKQIQDLQALQKTLTTLINTCRSGKGMGKCPIVETLLNNKTKSRL